MWDDWLAKLEGLLLHFHGCEFAQLCDVLESEDCAVTLIIENGLGGQLYDSHGFGPFYFTIAIERHDFQIQFDLFIFLGHN